MPLMIMSGFEGFQVVEDVVYILRREMLAFLLFEVIVGVDFQSVHECLQISDNLSGEQSHCR